MIVLLALTLYLEYNVWQSLSFLSNFFSLIYYHAIKLIIILQIYFISSIMGLQVWAATVGMSEDKV